MKFETVLNALMQTYVHPPIHYKENVSRRIKFLRWLLRRDEQQRLEIERLKAQVENVTAERGDASSDPQTDLILEYPSGNGSSLMSLSDKDHMVRHHRTTRRQGDKMVTVREGTRTEIKVD